MKALQIDQVLVTCSEVCVNGLGLNQKPLLWSWFPVGICIKWRILLTRDQTGLPGWWKSPVLWVIIPSKRQCLPLNPNKAWEIGGVTQSVFSPPPHNLLWELSELVKLYTQSTRDRRGILPASVTQPCAIYRLVEGGFEAMLSKPFQVTLSVHDLGEHSTPHFKSHISSSLHDWYRSEL